MISESAGLRDLSPEATSIQVDPEKVRTLAHCGPDGRWLRSAKAAVAEARELFEPRARWKGLSAGDLEGLFPSPTPVEEIARRGDTWAFVGTIGPGLEARARDHLAGARYLEGVLLDAAGSVAVEALCDMVEGMCAPGGSATRFSPGYCAWSLAGQKRLFSLLRPEDLGVELLPSFLMRPLKSVTGIVVSADPEALTVPPAACEQCDAQGCTRRQARRVA
jgi:hypothetical protein